MLSTGKEKSIEEGGPAKDQTQKKECTAEETDEEEENERTT